MTKILCRCSKDGKKYHVLFVNDVFVFLKYDVLYRLAMSVGVSNIDLHNMNVGDEINL